MTKELDAAPGDIRALKYRIHELEGEVMGYKRILDGQCKAVAHVGNMDHGPFDITPTAYGCDHLKNGDKLYTSPPDHTSAMRLAQSIIAENARGLRESNEGIYAHHDTLQRAAFEDWYDSGAENRDEFMALVDAALQPQSAEPDCSSTGVCVRSGLYVKAAVEPVPMTDTEISNVYFGATGQSLRPSDMFLVRLFAHAIEARTRATPPDPGGLLRDALSNLNDLADQKNAEIDALKEAMRLALSMLHFMNDNGYRLEEYEQGRMDAAIAALEGVVK